jgi:hypothetical protein
MKVAASLFSNPEDGGDMLFRNVGFYVVVSQKI